MNSHVLSKYRFGAHQWYLFEFSNESFEQKKNERL